MRREIRCLIFLLFFLLGLHCHDSLKVVDISDEKSDQDTTTVNLSIPDSIIAESNDFVISKVGEPFFNSYIKFDSSKSKYSAADPFCIEHPSSCAAFLLNPHYYIVYKFKIPEKVFIDEIIQFVTDVSGDIVPDRDVYGIPKCSNNDCWNNFTVIDKDEAIQIAQNEGLEEGIREWSISFYFYAGDFNDYVWGISNTLYQINLEWGGKGLIINASNGEIYEKYSWTMVP